MALTVSKNNIKIQGFSTLDLITVLSSVVAVAVIVCPIFMRHTNRDHNKQAIEVAKGISGQLAVEMKEHKIEANQDQGRGIASAPLNQISWEGIAGKDPWGNPFNYRILKNALGRPKYLVVWSKGPNSVQDTSEYNFNSENGAVTFAGDDVGVVNILDSVSSL